jgi:hypothetical protein
MLKTLFRRIGETLRWLTGPDGWIMPVCEIDLKVGGAWLDRPRGAFRVPLPGTDPAALRGGGEA